MAVAKGGVRASSTKGTEGNPTSWMNGVLTCGPSQVQNLQAARGAGTSMISLIIPPRFAASRDSLKCPCLP